jgi:hypothetical protein
MPSDRSPRTQAIIDLLAAHQELTSLEWVEFRQSMNDAATWGVVALVAAIAAWLGFDATVFVLLRQDPALALGVITAVNAFVAILAAFQVRRKLKRPFFSLTKRETAHDLQMVLRGLS